MSKGACDVPMSMRKKLTGGVSRCDVGVHRWEVHGFQVNHVMTVCVSPNEGAASEDMVSEYDKSRCMVT